MPVARIRTIGLVSLAALAAALLLPLSWKPVRTPQTLKVLTLNVQFLPSVGSFFNKRPDAEYRARTLAKLLGAYDLIGLNEVFHERHSQILLTEIEKKYPGAFHRLLPPPEDRSFFGIGSGLALLSRYPIVTSHSCRFGNDSSVWAYGPLADGFAAKGALHARIARADATADDYVDVFVTHLESSDAAIREKQYDMLANFIRRYADPGRPFVLLGDFNTDGNPPHMQDPGSQYPRMIKALQASYPSARLTDLWPLLCQEAGGTNDPDSPAGGERIDYVFLADPSRVPVLRAKAIRVNRFLDPHVTSLSDHSGVEADLEWTPRY